MKGLFTVYFLVKIDTIKMDNLANAYSVAIDTTTFEAGAGKEYQPLYPTPAPLKNVLPTNMPTNTAIGIINFFILLPRTLTTDTAATRTVPAAIIRRAG
ncbi:hypothetical protein COO59_00695 [Mixta theicola]|uniref:Uncharacterized protein n=1 Tax=Mixta theicola TaxID=1458355 RepID=A0A2K1QEB6_9GAMM|nr:hypothetical protein COO59_00695 [Mixta theicola]